MLGRVPVDRFAFLEQAAQHRRLFLLSNTNAIHKQAFSETLSQQLQSVSFAGFFEKCYYSHEMGMRKPDVEIFQKVMDDNGLSPANTLFIDDSIANIEGAKRVGLQVYHLQEDMTLCPDLAFLLQPQAMS